MMERDQDYAGGRGEMMGRALPSITITNGCSKCPKSAGPERCQHCSPENFCCVPEHGNSSSCVTDKVMCPKCSPNNFCRDPKHGNSEDNPAHKSSCRKCSHDYFNNVSNEQVSGREGGNVGYQRVGYQYRGRCGKCGKSVTKSHKFCFHCSHDYFNNVLNEQVSGREGNSRGNQPMHNHSRHNSYGEGRGREFFGTVGGVFGSTATHLFTSLQGTKSKGAHIFDTGARTCSCGKDISSRPANHTQCLTCYRRSQNKSESEDEEYERECRSCGGDISNRPLNFTQCLDCWRGGRGGRSNNNFFVRFS